MLDDINDEPRRMDKKEPRNCLFCCCRKDGDQVEEIAAPLDRRNKWWLVFTISGAILGIILGGICNRYPPPRAVLQLLAFPGQLFLNSLLQLSLPVIVTSLFVGVVSLGDLGGAGRLGFRSMLYYLFTTLFAAASGIGWVYLIRPGNEFSTSTSASYHIPITSNPILAILGAIREIFPDNLLTACKLQKQSTSFPAPLSLTNIRH